MEETLKKYLDDGWSANQDAEQTTEEPVGQSETTEPENSNVEQESSAQAETKEETKEENLEKELDAFELSKPDGEKSQSDLLSLANGLGLTRHNLPVEFESEEQIREVLSKGFDYTQKTQEFAEQKKAEETKLSEEREAHQKQVNEFQEYEKKVNNDLVSHQILFNVLKQLEAEDPEIVQQIERMYDKELQIRQSSMDNPVVNELKETINDLKSKVEGKDKESIEKENQAIIKEWETGLSEVQKSWGSKLNGLGVKPSWNKVQDIWKNDSSNTMTVKQAFLAVHGDDISKALESNKKLLETKVKSDLRKNDVVENQLETEEHTKPKKESYLDAAYKIAKRYAS